MPLTARTERALEACHDAILAPTRWPSALQSLAKSFGAASCTFYEHDRENSPAPVPMSVGHEAFSDRWARNQAHAPDPHVGPYLERCKSFIRAGWTSAIEHDLSTEEERRTLPFYQETARPEKREWFAASFFSVEGGDWCLPVFRGDGPFTPEDARRLARVGPYLAKIVSLAQKFAAFDAASKLSALERVSSAAVVIDATGRATQMNSACAKSAWRGLQPRPGSSGGPRSRQQSPIAAAGFVCSAYGARRRSGLCANRRRSGRSALAFGRGDAGHGVRQRFV